MEYDPLLDSSNMTYEDYARLASDIEVRCLYVFIYLHMKVCLGYLYVHINWRALTGFSDNWNKFGENIVKLGSVSLYLSPKIITVCYVKI